MKYESVEVRRPENGNAFDFATALAEALNKLPEFISDVQIVPMDRNHDGRVLSALILYRVAQ